MISVFLLLQRLKHADELNAELKKLQSDLAAFDANSASTDTSNSAASTAEGTETSGVHSDLRRKFKGL